MVTFLKKWFRAYKTIRIAVGTVYLFITLTIPLYHTCGLGCLAEQTCHCDNARHCSRSETNLGKQPDISLKQDDYNLTVTPDYGPCMACMYSTTSNATQVNTAAATIGHKVSTTFQPLPSSRAVKQSEWLSSLSLRAPPVRIS